MSRRFPLRLVLIACGFLASWWIPLPAGEEGDAGENSTPPAGEEKGKGQGAGGEKRGPDAGKKGDCLSAGCHEDLKKREEVHSPVAAGKCGACHKPVEGEEHDFEFPRDEAELCTFCHEQEEEKKFVHKPFKPDSCTSCHDPHGSKAKGLLATETTVELCRSCHEAKPDGMSSHRPYRTGQCTACHEPHQGDEEKLLVAPGRDLCAGCHDAVGESLEKEAHPHDPAKEGCTSCHVAHSGPNPSLLVKPAVELCAGCHEQVASDVAGASIVHGPIEKEGCGACHEPHASSAEGLLKKESARDLCLSCHSKPIDVEGRKIRNVGKEIAAKFLHAPVAKGQCNACHLPHAGENQGLLVEKYRPGLYGTFKEEEYALCFSCHSKELVTEASTKTATGFRHGDRNLHTVHVAGSRRGRSCRICHEVHGGPLPRCVRAEVPFGKGGWLLPIGFQKSESGGTCASGCHVSKSYDRGGASPAEKPQSPEEGVKPTDGGSPPGGETVSKPPPAPKADDPVPAIKDGSKEARGGPEEKAEPAPDAE